MARGLAVSARGLETGWLRPFLSCMSTAFYGVNAAGDDLDFAQSFSVGEMTIVILHCNGVMGIRVDLGVHLCMIIALIRLLGYVLLRPIAAWLLMPSSQFG